MVASLLTMTGICKQFGSVMANCDVDLTVNAGEVLALLGENGAGKSTLMKVLYGFYQADRGEINLDGKAAAIASPRDAMALGIGMVFQQFSLVPALSVLENLLSALPNAPWLQRRSSMRVKIALRWIERLAPHLDPSRPVRALSVGERQLVELSKVLNLDARIIILDEPTSVLTPPETQRLYGFIKTLSEEGKAVVLITHKFADIEACADRIVVMRGGRVVDEAMAKDRSPSQLVEAMVGHGVASSIALPRPPADTVTLLEVRDLNATVDGRSIHNVSFEVSPGEILGFAGVSGNGQFVLAEALAGLTSATTGDILLAGVNIAGKNDTSGIARDVAYIPERPLDNAVVAELDLALNLSLRDARDMPFVPSRRQLMQRAERLISDYDVRPPKPAMPAASLSGGNLQKLVIARELSGAHKLIVACYPTMGLDVAATQAVYGELFRHAASGACVIWISEDLDELLSYAHRIAVLHDGKIVGVVRSDLADRQVLGRWMTGVARRVA